MSPSAASKRPLTVTIVIALSVLLAVLDALAGADLVVAAPQADQITGLTAAQTVTAVRIVGGGFIAIGAAQSVVAVLLARRSNAARLWS